MAYKYNDFLKFKRENFYCKVPEGFQQAMKNIQKYSQQSTYLDGSNGICYGFKYGVARPQARNTQPLTQEQIQKLRTNSEAFDMKVTQEELWAAACTHRYKDGRSAMVTNGDITTCSICHKTFKFNDDIPADISNFIDALQTYKTAYLDTPDSLYYKARKAERKPRRPKEILHPDKIDFSTIDIDKLYEMMVLADEYNLDCMHRSSLMGAGYGPRRPVFFKEIEEGKGILQLTLEELDEYCQEWRIDAQLSYYLIYSGEILVMDMLERKLNYLKLAENLASNNILPNSEQAKEQYNEIIKKWTRLYDDDDED